MLSEFRNLVPVTREGLKIGRSASFVDRRAVVLFQKSGNAFECERQYDWPHLLATFDAGPIVELEPSDWPWSREASVNFNCHAMAIGSRVGLTPSDWLEGVASEATMQQNPTAIILNQFFDLIAVESPHSPTPPEVHEDAVFSLYDSNADHFVHSGFVRHIDGEVIAISKFGEGPILLTSVDLIARFYSGRFDEVRWYRQTASHLVSA